jgi:hypothetical protein
LRPGPRRADDEHVLNDHPDREIDMRKRVILGATLAVLAVAVPVALASGSGSGSVTTRAADDRGRHAEPGDDRATTTAGAELRHRSHEHHRSNTHHASRLPHD